jgi:hypothetical protein
MKRSFESVATKIAERQGVPMDRARSILAAGTRHAGAAARRKNPALNRVKKSVTLGMSYDQPLPMPFRTDGMPDWEAPSLGAFVSFVLENGPLKGRVVVLKRLPNGMYIIAPDGQVKNPANRDLDKEKMKKEEDEDSEHEMQDVFDSTKMGKSWRRKNTPVREESDPMKLMFSTGRITKSNRRLSKADLPTKPVVDPDRAAAIFEGAKAKRDAAPTSGSIRAAGDTRPVTDPGKESEASKEYARTIMSRGGAGPAGPGPRGRTQVALGERVAARKEALGSADTGRVGVAPAIRQDTGDEPEGRVRSALGSEIKVVGGDKKAMMQGKLGQVSAYRKRPDGTWEAYGEPMPDSRGAIKADTYSLTDIGRRMIDAYRAKNPGMDWAQAADALSRRKEQFGNLDPKQPRAIHVSTDHVKKLDPKDTVAHMSKKWVRQLKEISDGKIWSLLQKRALGGKDKEVVQLLDQKLKIPKELHDHILRALKSDEEVLRESFAAKSFSLSLTERQALQYGRIRKSLIRFAKANGEGPNEKDLMSFFGIGDTTPPAPAGRAGGRQRSAFDTGSDDSSRRGGAPKSTGDAWGDVLAQLDRKEKMGGGSVRRDGQATAAEIGAPRGDRSQSAIRGRGGAAWKNVPSVTEQAVRDAGRVNRGATVRVQRPDGSVAEGTSRQLAAQRRASDKAAQGDAMAKLKQLKEENPHLSAAELAEMAMRSKSFAKALQRFFKALPAPRTSRRWR